MSTYRCVKNQSYRLLVEVLTMFDESMTTFAELQVTLAAQGIDIMNDKQFIADCRKFVPNNFEYIIEALHLNDSYSETNIKLRRLKRLHAAIATPVADGYFLCADNISDIQTITENLASDVLDILDTGDYNSDVDVELTSEYNDFLMDLMLERSRLLELSKTSTDTNKTACTAESRL